MVPAHALRELVESHRRLFVLTGAGVSTDSGIPDYRDEAGAWKRRPPVQLRDFVTSERMRRRYWSRSLVGWPVMAGARPNAAHQALASLEATGRVGHLVTQNVDGLHQKAGSRRVLDLHGRIDANVCLACGGRSARADYQVRLAEANPAWRDLEARVAPDGDADLEERNLDGFHVPPCAVCGGVLKPDVVFFGESVPKPRVETAYAHLEAADAVLAVGTSLMVFSGLRFVRAAAKRKIPIAIVNRGRTRADDLAAVKVEAACGEALASLARDLG